MTAMVQGASEDLDIFVDRSVLNARRLAVFDLPLILEPLAEEIDLKVKRPARHVRIKIVEVGIVDHRLQTTAPSELCGEGVRECGLPYSDVSGDRDKVLAF